MNISFFIVDPGGQGLSVDNAVIIGISRKEFWRLSKNEKDFLLWYLDEIRINGLEGLLIGSSDESLDMPQEEICKQFMNMIRAKTVPDPELN